MNGLIKKFSMLLVLTIMLTLSVSTGKAATFPQNINGVQIGESLGYNGLDSMPYKTYPNGVVFCSTFHTFNIASSCTLDGTQWSMPTQAGVAAIIEKYNANPSKQAYYNSELAINEFLYYYETKDSVNRISSTRDVRNTSGVKDFYDAAVKAYNEAKEKFEITLTTESGKLTFTKKDDYYVSNKLTVTGTNEYETAVSGVDGVEVYDKKDNTFSVRFPAKNIKAGEEVTVSVAVKGKKNISVAKRYDCGSDSQKLVPNIVETTPLNGSATIKGSIKTEKTKLKISKKDITTQEELKGAHLVLKTSDGKLVDEWDSDVEAHYIEGLEPGDYKLTETIAPEGYKLSEDTVEFTLDADGKVKEVVMYNAHKDKYKVKISKQDITTKQELPGATLIIKDKDGNEITRWVSGEEPHYVELEAGEYTLTEIQAPNGYDLSYEVIKFTVGEDGEVETYVVMYNSKTPNTGDKNIFFITGLGLLALVGAGYSIFKIKKHA